MEDQARIEELRKEIIATQRSIRYFSGRERTINSQIESVRSATEQIRERMSDQRRFYEALLTSRQSQIDQHMRERDEMIARIREIARHAESLREGMEVKQRDVSLLGEHVNALEPEYAVLDAQMKEVHRLELRVRESERALQRARSIDEAAVSAEARMRSLAEAARIAEERLEMAALRAHTASELLSSVQTYSEERSALDEQRARTFEERAAEEIRFLRARKTHLERTEATIRDQVKARIALARVRTNAIARSPLEIEWRYRESVLAGEGAEGGPPAKRARARRSALLMFLMAH